ncbi:Fanconi anemia core complex-associated protein 24 isoform X1 [Monodelphis domestica]|uniref:Fanconi anemia core complex-associated protein 24 isoform X1 n=2 Tax=Monodelphis domestica TaxID=13616 RepID=UPI0024E1E231|nr:Fanconi anemia core complex-associated protein 24 isoform X1 [Monodelphis domestica]
MRGGLLGQLGFGNSYRTGRKKKNRTTLERRTSPRATYLDIVTKGRLSLSLKKAWHQWIFTFLIDSVFFILLKQIWWQEITIKKELFNLEIYFSLLKASNLKGIIIVEKTQMSEQYFTTVQKFVVLELGMTLLPVSNQMEASQLIIQLVHEQTKERNRNPFLKKKSCQLCESSVLQTVQQIPGVGKVMALLLLQEFPSIQKLSNASIQELERVVGHTLAEKMHTFFTQIR